MLAITGGQSCSLARVSVHGVWSSDRARSVTVNGRSLSETEPSEVEAVDGLVRLAPDACGEKSRYVPMPQAAPGGSFLVMSSSSLA